jgi:uncharacterized DUF497 family protein
VELEFEWDEKKASANLDKHAVSFLTAAEIFGNEIMERIDDREEYGEIRFIALGRVDADVFRVVFTWRSESLIRMSSGRAPASSCLAARLPFTFASIAILSNGSRRMGKAT